MKSFHSNEPVAGPCSPVNHQAHGANELAWLARRGRIRTRYTSTPLAMNTHTISDSVSAVTAAVIANTAHSNGSFASVSFVSFCTLRAMIAITARSVQKL